ncbi:AraC family transcriptional regulator [uncultured Kordia sp.]|uniref:helix-turn-helix domain-containing protein n=1 Tax=uncultured Kordia sp. TaxID=507699 RepID=UPI002625BAD0|nr:response regulator transcription factor [uncultured Kordia sp.]
MFNAVNDIPIHNLSTIDSINIEFISHTNSYDYKAIHRHNYYEILFFKNGGGYQIIDFKKHPIQHNSCYVVKPRQVHLIRREEEADGLLIQFTEPMIFSDVLKKSLSVLDRLHNEPVIFEHNKVLTDFFIIALEDIKQLSDEKSMFYKQKIAHELCSVLYNIEESLQKNTERKTRVTSDLISNFANLIETNMTRLSVKEYADLLHVSTKKLAQITKKQLGLTPLKYIHKQLLIEIKRDLTFKELSHKEIAYNYNFDSPSNFSLFVKSQTGLSPSELQKNLLENYQ